MVKITETVSLEKDKDIGMIWIDNPPVNAPGQSIRQGLKNVITAAKEGDGIKALVVMCRGRTFFAGADIREIGPKTLIEPFLPAVLNMMEDCQV